MSHPTLSSETLHASTVAIGELAILICGRSGSGKSDLALRLIDRGAQLVSDDYTLVRRINGRLVASAPSTIRDVMEVRGLGIVPMPSRAEAMAALIVDLDEPVTRMPISFAARPVAGLKLPVVPLAAFEPSAPIKAEFALRLFGLQENGAWRA